MRAKLSGLEISEDYLQKRDRYSFRTLETKLYAVDSQFPKIVPSSFAGLRLPPGTFRLRYAIDLSNEPPFALDPTSTERVIHDLAESGPLASST
jgi:hypothetical protein